MIYTQIHKDGCHFRVWAPEHTAMTLELDHRVIAMEKDPSGYFFADVPDAADGTQYRYRVKWRLDRLK